MACKQTISVAGKTWHLYRTTESGLCCYKVVVSNKNAAEQVIADAKAKPDYVRPSQFYDVPGNKIQFYLYFQPS